jgi:hypothetical protein
MTIPAMHGDDRILREVATQTSQPRRAEERDIVKKFELRIVTDLNFAVI